MRAYLGVDWSATELVCALGEGESAPSRPIKGARRTLASVRDLVARVRDRLKDVDEVHVIIEAGAPGWVELLHFAGVIVHVVDAKQAKAFAASLGSSGAKDDARDSAVLVAMGRSPSHMPPAWKPSDAHYEQLCTLGGMHETVTAELVAAQQRLRSHLRERLPTVEAVIPDLTVKWAGRLLRAAPTARHAATLDELRLAEILAGSGAREKSREGLLAALAASAQPWLSEAVAQVQALIVVQFLDQIDLLSKQLVALDEALDALTADLDIRKNLESVDGIGERMAHRLLQFAFPAPAADRDQAGILMGASPVFQGSGKTPKGKPKGKAKMRKSTNPRARQTTYLLGRLVSQQLGWAKRMYEDARSRGQGAALAYRRIARSMLRILTAMVRNGTPYDDDRYVAALRAKGVPWAGDAAATA